jgi:hypothetical protein
MERLQSGNAGICRTGNEWHLRLFTVHKGTQNELRSAMKTNAGGSRLITSFRISSNPSRVPGILFLSANVLAEHQMLLHAKKVITLQFPVLD